LNKYLAFPIDNF